jgi:hypothetical protein
MEPGAAPGPGGTADRGWHLRIARLTIADGDVRFIDRTVTPTYSEELSELALAATDLATGDEDTAEVTVHGIVGGRAALELRGEVAPFGEPFYLDVTGTLRDFPAPRTNPYVRHHTAWAIERGEVRTDVHYRIVGDELEATNRLVVERLAVTQLEPEARVEIPLGLVVSLLKDRRGDIRLTVPVRGRLGSPEFDFGEALGRAFKNVLTRLVSGPLRAIGRVFRSPEDGAVAAVAVDPVPFEPGSARRRSSPCASRPRSPTTTSRSSRRSRCSRGSRTSSASADCRSRRRRARCSRPPSPGAPCRRTSRPSSRRCARPRPRPARPSCGRSRSGASRSRAARSRRRPAWSRSGWRSRPSPCAWARPARRGSIWASTPPDHPWRADAPRADTVGYADP